TESDHKYILENFETEVLTTEFNSLVDRHYKNRDKFSPLISISFYEDVAIAVGKYFGKKRTTEESREFYLFKINIPEIDLIYYTSHGVNNPPYYKECTNKIQIGVEEKTNTYYWNKNFESRIMYKIDPEEIIEISQPQIIKSFWKKANDI
ncbi:MAG: hypothetical protein ACP5N1_05565, partial [Candidatus Woesearchaeota archaeon]